MWSHTGHKNLVIWMQCMLIYLATHPAMHAIRYLSEWLSHFNLLGQCVDQLINFSIQKSLKEMSYFSEVVIIHWYSSFPAFLCALSSQDDTQHPVLVSWAYDCIPIHSEFCEAAIAAFLCIHLYQFWYAPSTPCTRPLTFPNDTSWGYQDPSSLWLSLTATWMSNSWKPPAVTGSTLHSAYISNSASSTRPTLTCLTKWWPSGS